MTGKITEKAAVHKLAAVLGLALVGVLVVSFFALIILPKSSDTRRVYYHEQDPLDFRPVRGRELAPLDVSAAFLVSAKAVEKGRTLYKAQCASCHGPEGEGNGAAGRGLNPPPRNLTVKDGWKNGFKLATLFETLTSGLGGMPAFDYLTSQERFALAHYVQSLGDFDHGTDEPSEIEALSEKYRLGEAGREPNRVGLSFAGKRIIAEQGAARIVMPSVDEHDRAAEIVRQMVRDPLKAAWFLSRVANWDRDPSNLVRLISRGAPVNGFDPAIALLTVEEAELFVSALKKGYQFERREG